jgi:hypothetical protein
MYVSVGSGLTESDDLENSHAILVAGNSLPFASGPNED